MSNAATSTVSVTPVNDAPVNTVPGAQTVAENGSLVFDVAHAGPISISDVDANGGKETVVLTAGDGALTLSQTTNLHFIVGTNGSGSMIIEGALNDLDAALNGLTYTPNHNFTGSDSISITTLDEGNTGTGGQQADSKTIAITVTPTGTAPVVTEGLAHDTGTLSNDGITSDPTVTGTGDANAVVHFIIDNVAVANTVTADGSGSWTFTPVLTDGNHTVVAFETNGAGTGVASTSFTLDTTNPAAPTVALTTDSGSSNSDHITNVGTLNVTGVEPGALVEYSTNGGSTWTSSFTAVEGLDNVQVRETDVAGNHSTATSFSFTLDTTNPAAPTVALTTDSGSSNSDHITNVGTLNVTGVEPGALVEYSTNGGSTWTSSFTAVEGLDNVQVRETDVAGNHSTATSFSFTLDTSADKSTPATLVTNGTIDDVINNTEKTAVAYTVAGLDTDATAVITFASTGGGTKTANVSANGTFSVDLTSSRRWHHHRVDVDHRYGRQHQDGDRYVGERYDSEA